MKLGDKDNFSLLWRLFLGMLRMEKLEMRTSKGQHMLAVLEKAREAAFGFLELSRGGTVNTLVEEYRGWS